MKTAINNMKYGIIANLLLTTVALLNADDDRDHYAGDDDPVQWMRLPFLGNVSASIYSIFDIVSTKRERGYALRLPLSDHDVDLMSVELYHPGVTSYTSKLRILYNNGDLQIVLHRDNETIAINRWNHIVWGHPNINDETFSARTEMKVVGPPMARHIQRTSDGLEILHGQPRSAEIETNSVKITYYRRRNRIKIYDLVENYTLTLYANRGSYKEEGANHFDWNDSSKRGSWESASIKGRIHFVALGVAHGSIGKYKFRIRPQNTTISSTYAQLRWPNEGEYFELSRGDASMSIIPGIVAQCYGNGLNAGKNWQVFHGRNASALITTNDNEIFKISADGDDLTIFVDYIGQ